MRRARPWPETATRTVTSIRGGIIYFTEVRHDWRPRRDRCRFERFAGWAKREVEAPFPNAGSDRFQSCEVYGFAGCRSWHLDLRILSTVEPRLDSEHSLQIGVIRLLQVPKRSAPICGMLQLPWKKRRRALFSWSTSDHVLA